MKQYDIAVIGGGVVGTATARALMETPGLSVIVLEAEDKLAAHQTGNNSGVIHSGLYYKPGSLKAKNCVEGRLAMYRYCQEHNIPHENCGKVVVAVVPEEKKKLEELEQKGIANGLQGLKRLTPEEIKEYEPHVVGVAGLHVQETGIADYTAVTQSYAEEIKQNGGEIWLSSRVTGFLRENGGLVLETAKGVVKTKNLVNCAGLYCDLVAKMCGVDPKLQIVPFRGEYYVIKPERRHLVKNLVYPVPDPQFPFLGVHFTRMIDGGVEAGPNAVLAFKREGYTRTSFSVTDCLRYAGYKGFWLMAAKYWRMGFDEMHRSFSKNAFVKALQRLIPEISSDDITPGGAGVRAQALEPTGFLVDDFRIVEADRMVHVLNAPSPAATASISIGNSIAQLAKKNFSL